MNDDLETRLRASLDSYAGRAPQGQALAERIIVEAGLRPTGDVRRLRERRWRTWTLPLLAAGAVAAVAAVAVGLGQPHHSAGPSPVPPAVSPSLTTPTGSPTAAVGPTTSPTVTQPPSRSAAAGNITSGFAITDMSFVGPDDGWALGSANCLGRSGTCTALLRTSDGVHWTQSLGSGSTPFNVGTSGDCAEPCVTGIRFYNDSVGYAYGSAVLDMTVDGGRTWMSGGSGGASDIEMANGTAVRVVNPASGGGQVLTAVPGSAQWRAAALPWTGAGGLDAFRLTRSGADVAVTAYPVAGSMGGPQLFWSSDDGRTWVDRGEQCSGLAGISIATGGSLTEECDGAGSHASVRVSTDGGTSFGPIRTIVQGPSAGTVVAAVNDHTILAWASESSPTLLLTTDAGLSWRTVAVDPRGTVGSSFLGCETATLCRWAPAGTGTLHTSSDAGLTWTPTSYDGS